MSCDKLVFDLSQEVEGSPNVFIRKDWLNILDNQNTNYQNNQSIIDTSQLANSNKYMAYREAYLTVPLLLSMSGQVTQTGTAAPYDYSIGLKNWFGSIIHSMTLDYNGTTIVQQTPFCNMWNSFKLLTTLSWSDVMTMGSTIGFYPDTPDSFIYMSTTAGTSNGTGTTNNDMGIVNGPASTIDINNYTQYTSTYGGNMGITYRTKWIAYPAYTGSTAGNTSGGSSYITNSVSAASCNQIWKSYIHKKQAATTTVKPLIQYSVMATIYLKHLHSFFNMCPLLKGVFMKFTMNLNNCVSTVTVAGNAGVKTMALTSSQSYIGGVVPLMIPSISTGSGWLNTVAGTTNTGNGVYTYELAVGYQSFNTTILGTAGYTAGQLAKSIYLYVPAYTFNPTFEQAYLSNNIKQIKYTDIYQYQVLNVGGAANSGQFNNLITNGIANIKSVLIIPFYATDDATPPNAISTWQSPFDTAGCGTTSPMVTLGNFNVQISGQNAIYNMQRYSFEEWNNQLYGQNAVNGGLTDGLTSGLIDFSGFQSSYSYYYVNVERMLPVEQSVPKSVQIIGTNYSQRALNLWVFVEYGVQVSIDVLTGARV